MNDAPEPKTYRFQLMWEPSLIEEIDDYCFTNRIRSRAEAVRALTKRGLSEAKGAATREGLGNSPLVAVTKSSALQGAENTNG